MSCVRWVGDFVPHKAEGTGFSAEGVHPRSIRLRRRSGLDTRTCEGISPQAHFPSEADPPPEDESLSSAVGVRFELTMPFRAYRISSAAPSATQPPHRTGQVVKEHFPPEADCVLWTIATLLYKTGTSAAPSATQPLLPCALTPSRTEINSLGRNRSVH